MTKIAPITDTEFAAFQRFLFKFVGISLKNSKKAQVTARLASRLNELKLTCFQDYLDYLYVEKSGSEVDLVISRLTTHETHFYRDPQQFQTFRSELAKETSSGKTYRAWSAACSTGEEAYSIAMDCAEQLGENWEVVGSDISTEVISRARKGLYTLVQAETIPSSYLKKYCLKGTGSYKGMLKFSDEIRDRVSFKEINLHEPITGVGQFDAVFLRNLLIYFNAAEKQKIIGNVCQKIRPGGLLLVGNTESLAIEDDDFEQISGSTFKRCC